MNNRQTTELRSHSVNQRIYGEEDLPSAFIDSIKSQGILEPIQINSDNTIISGHRRWRAAKQIGLDTVPVIVCDYNGEMEERLALIEFNRQREKTFSQRMKEAEELEAIEKERAALRRKAAQNNEAAREVRAVTANLPELGSGETREKVAKQTGIGSARTYDTAKKLWSKANEGDETAAKLVKQIDAGETTISGAYKKIKKQNEIKDRHEAIKHQTAEDTSAMPCLIACQDAVEWIKGQDQYDLLLTDPPYSTDVDDIGEFAESWLPLALSKLKSTGRAFVFVGAYPNELQAYINVAMPEQILVWTYRNTLGPSPKMNYKLNWQAILYYRMPDAVPLDCPSMIEQLSVQDISAPDGRLGDRYHAWQKPMEIGERFIRHATKRGETVVDPFACTGTFLLAAAKLGRAGRGCDIDENNIAIALERGCKSA
jgi:ParB/RepB/Spo0J family partition protein